MDNEIIFLKPVFKEKIWGGDRLRTDFCYDTPSDTTGECWAISAHPNGDCVISEGIHKGKHLSELWNEHREIFGNAEGNCFPLLIKIIDAKQDLSIQVHPNDEYAKIHENGSLGKTECWYVLDCDDDATIVIGHNAKDKTEMESMIRNKRWNEFFREIPVHKGDFFQINPGCLHAIKGGTMILETQQNSDITYRVYDYDRLQNDKPRELHIEKSLDVITAPFEKKQSLPTVIKNDCYNVTRLVKCDYYTVEKIDVKDKAMIEQSYCFMNVSVIDGCGMVNGKPIKKGSHFIIPYGCADVEFIREMTLIVSYVG